MKRYGIEWTEGLDYEQEWSGIANDRFCVQTWKFGSIHQCVIDVKYKSKNGYVRMCLNCQSSRDKAMKHALEWVKNYKGPPPPEQMIRECYDHWPSLYTTRIRVLDHTLCTIGNGYDWLDGGVTCTSPEDWIGAYDAPEPEHSLALNNSIQLLSKLAAATDDEHIKEMINDLTRKREIPDPKTLPLPDDGKPYPFYPLSSYSNILNIPADATKEWLEFCLEAATLLRDRSTDMDGIEGNIGAPNRKYGAKLVKQIQKRL